MKTLKNRLLTIVALLCSITASAYDFEVDGICYKITSSLNLTASVYGYHGSNKEVIIPESVTYDGSIYSITDIRGGAFEDCSSLTSISIPNTITSIRHSVFQDCTGLKTFTIPNSVTDIGDTAFAGCTGLTSIIIPNSVTYIDNHAFYGCSMLEVVYFTAVTKPYIAPSAFNDTHSLLQFYVANKSMWESGTNAGELVEYISFNQNEFGYNGQTPTLTFTNNLNRYDLTMDMISLQKDAGTYETSFKATYSNGLELEIPYSYTINKAPLTVNVNNAQRLYGEQNPVFTSSVTGFVNNEDESVFDSPISLSSTANATSNVGTYPITATASAKNYDFTVNQGTLTVKKAPLAVKANDKTRVYGDEDPQFDVTYIGLRNGETTPVLTSELNLSTDAVKRSNVGTYEILVSGGVATNYEFTEYQSGMLTVTQAPLIITAQSTIRKYGDENPTFQYAYSGFKNNDTEANLQTLPIVTTDATPLSGIGTYVITPNGAVAKNYSITYENGTLTIEKAPLLIRANDVSRVYGDENPEFTFTYGGFKNGDTDLVLSALPLASSVSKTSPVGTYDIVPYDAAAKNYSITYENGTLTITKAPLKVTVTDNTKIYGDENPQVELTYSGFRNSDGKNDLTSVPTVKTEATILSPVGTYTLIPEGGTAANYEFTEYISGTLTVEKAPLTLVADNAKRLYFEGNPAFTFHGAGWKNGDTKNCLTVQPTLICSAKNVSNAGEYEISLEGADAKNYELSYTSGILTIGKREVTVTVNNAEKIYGEENPEFTYSLAGLVNNESEKVFTSPVIVQSEAEKMSDAGTYEIIALGAEATNYDFVYNAGTLTIGKAAQEIIWEQDLTDIPLYTQIPLEAIATSGLDVEYEAENNDIVSIYEVGGKPYIDCSRSGKVIIKAIQTGNHNYYAAANLYKTLIVIDPMGVKAVEDESVNIYATDGRIIVENAKDNILVYDLTGRLVKSVQPTEVQTEVPMKADAFYIVRTGNVTKKVKL